MKLVIGCPVANRAWVLPRWFEAIYAQDVDFDVICLYSESEDDTLDILHEHGTTIIFDNEPPRPRHMIDRHEWGDIDVYTYMARIRNQLLEHVIDSGADFFFSLDSDILLPAGALKVLLDYLADLGGVVAPFVNLGRGSYAPNRGTWAKHGRCTRINYDLIHTERAEIVMAAMMLDRVGMEGHWAAHPDGEDLGFCRLAALKQIPLWWVPEVHCTHLMRPNC